MPRNRPPLSSLLLLLCLATACGRESGEAPRTEEQADSLAPDLETGTTGAPGPGTTGTPGTSAGPDPDTMGAADTTTAP